MLSYGITEIQSNLGYFISAKYESYIKPLIEKIDREEKLNKLRRLSQHQDLEFAELGVDDGGVLPKDVANNLGVD